MALKHSGGLAVHNPWPGAVPVLAFTVLLALTAPAQAPAPAPAIPKVSVVKPQSRPVKETVKLPATLNADERVSICAKLDGYLAKIAVDKGDQVKKGQVLAELSVPEMGPELALAKAKAGAAKAHLGKALASVEVETATHHRLATLHAAEPGAVTQEDVEVSEAKEKTARAEAESVRAEIEVANAEVQRLQALMEYLHIPAPFDGTITQRFVDEGALVTAAPGGGRPIMEIARVSRLRLAFDLPERLVPFVKPGYALRYTLAALPGKAFDGVVARRTETLSDGAHTMLLEIDVDNANLQFAPGMYGSVQIPIADIPGVTLLPASAVRTVDAKPCVFAIEAGKLKKVLVEPLLNDGPSVIVSGELGPETAVVAHGPAALVEGQQVEAAEGE